MPAEAITCIVCGDSDTNEGLFEYCWGCNERFHFNPAQGPGKDCGQAWIDDDEEGMQTFCNTCMDRQRREDHDQMQQFAAAAATGTATPEMMTQIMQMLGGAVAPSMPAPAVPAAGMPFPGGTNPFGGGMPAPFGMPLPGGQQPGIPMPPGISFPGMDALADAVVIVPPSAPAAEHDAAPAVEPSSPATAPPARARRQPGEPRRFRRID